MSRQELQRQKAIKEGRPPPPPPAAKEPGAPRAPQEPLAPHERVTFGKKGSSPKDVHALAARLTAACDGATADAGAAVKTLLERCDRFEVDFAKAQAAITRLESGLLKAYQRLRELGEDPSKIDAEWQHPAPAGGNPEGVTVTPTYEGATTIHAGPASGEAEATQAPPDDPPQGEAGDPT